MVSLRSLGEARWTNYEPTVTTQPEVATFAAGCFWGVEHIFLKHFPPSEKKGIISTAVGYTGGNPLVTNPTYQLVCGGATDHAEAVKIEFDPSIVSYDQLVGMSYMLHTFVDDADAPSRILLPNT
jgi:peptide-methionine (S)-S-oxide reductase